MARRVRQATRSRGGERGQALVEFAIILPLFVVLVVGIIQFGVGLNYWLDMNRIANQGARWAVVNKFPADPDGPGPALGASGPCVTDAAVVCTGSPPSGSNFQQYLASEPVSGGLNPCVTVAFPNTSDNVGEPVKVELEMPFTFVPILDLGTITLRANATMRLEQPRGRYVSGQGGTSC